VSTKEGAEKGRKRSRKRTRESETYRLSDRVLSEFQLLSPQPPHHRQEPVQLVVVLSDRGKVIRSVDVSPVFEVADRFHHRGLQGRSVRKEEQGGGRREERRRVGRKSEKRTGNEIRTLVRSLTLMVWEKGV
jgi:hypothetical protein